MSDKIVRVKISEFRVAAAPIVLKISGLGSCVALALYDPVARLGGLAHILLPGPAPEKEPIQTGMNTTRYADRAIQGMLEQMIEAGARTQRITARIVGGANMFSATDEEYETSPVKAGIGQRNVEAVKAHLKAVAIALAGENVGGKAGRTIAFDTRSGRIVVTNTRGEKAEL